METITYKNQVKKPFKKLGFSYLDTAEIVVSLRQLLIEYQIHYHKLRIYHWNVQGPEFFELHNEFEQEYTKVQEQIDIIAERIRVFGQNPAISLTDTIKNAKIQENVEAMNAKSMVLDILKDFGILHGTMLDVLDASFNIGDIATEKIITDFIQELEKRNWMFSSWLK